MTQELPYLPDAQQAIFAQSVHCRPIKSRETMFEVLVKKEACADEGAQAVGYCTGAFPDLEILVD
jgi:hypothetical protein